MKKLLFSSILMLAASLFFTACTKEGPAGPTGSTGPAGPSVNNAIIVKNITISTWTSYSGGKYYRGTTNVPEITNNIIDGGAILAYLNDGTIFNPLPFTFSDLSESYRFYYSLNSFRAENSYAVARTMPASANYRIIIIPGALGARTPNGGFAGTNYTFEQLQYMSYEDACKALDVKP